MNREHKRGISITTAHEVMGKTKSEVATVLAGNQSLAVNIVNNEGIPNWAANPYVTISPRVARKLKLLEHCRYNYQIISCHPLVIRLGPIVGVLSTVKISPQSGLPVGKEAKLFREMFIFAARQGIFMFLFTINGINWSKGLIKGYTCIADKSAQTGPWLEKTFPFPDIVYNRLRYRHIENQPRVKKYLAKFNNAPEIHLFNSRFLEKWEIYQVLSEHMAEILPPTQLFNKLNLAIFLRKYPEIFLKPRNSSIGKGIIKIKNVAPHGYIYSEANSSHWERCFSLEGLYWQVKMVINNHGDYIIQKGIDMARLDGKIFDLRTQVQKDGSGNWVQTGVAVRVAAQNRFVTHIPNGGKAASYEEVMTKVFGSSEKVKDRFNLQLDNIREHVPHLLEQHLGLKLGILSIDVAVDTAGKMWIIEVNSKPAGFDEDHIRKRHLQYLIDYFLFLTRNNEVKRN